MVLVTGIMSMISTNSLSNLWSIIGQIQIYFLLLLTKAFIPNDVKTVITGSELFLNPFGSISFSNLPILGRIIEKFNFELSNPNLNPFGLNSDSSLYNTLPLFLFLALVVIFHLFLKLLQKVLISWGPWSSRWGWLIRVINWIGEKLLIILTYGYYIRFILQMLQLILVTSTHEISDLKLTNIHRIISFVFAIFLLFGWILIAGIVTYMSLSSYKISEEGHSKIGEIFSGMKMDKKYKIYASIIIMRKTVFIILLIFMIFVSSRLLIIILGLFQIWYNVYVLYVPF